MTDVIDSLEINADITSGEATLRVNLNGIVTMLSGTENGVTYNWNFGNDTTATGQNVTAIFNEEGDYTVVLTASTESNTITTSVVINVTPSIFIESDLSISYRDGGANITDNSIKPHFEILNNGTAAVPYSNLTIRYWFTSEDNNSLNFWCDWAQLGTTNVFGTFGEANGMNYLEISFNSAAGYLSPGANSGNIQNRFAKNDWSNFNESDDYSYNVNKTTYTQHQEATLYQNGILVWGIEPISTARATAETTFIAFPNPATNTITIQDTTNLLEAKVAIYDLSGNEILTTKSLSSNNFEINLPDLDSGMYILKLTTLDQVIQTRIISVK